MGFARNRMMHYAVSGPINEVRGAARGRGILLRVGWIAIAAPDIRITIDVARGVVVELEVEAVMGAAHIATSGQFMPEIAADNIV
ncbi:hypothetical protein AA309_15625 [Microvirga vignae]|uniref:Uncharacterized protein n=1 Tax=Microvirga vignae TaxID=1225564 RepID=A0A0H1RAL1_9HYPH|nr:hypothetical protein AA309_15625 [Microvirga vignae]